jgi:hypothetical protein
VIGWPCSFHLLLLEKGRPAAGTGSEKEREEIKEGKNRNRSVLRKESRFGGIFFVAYLE